MNIDCSFTENSTGYRLNGYLGSEHYWIDINTKDGTINLPATGDIDGKGVADLMILLSIAADRAGIL